MKIVRIRKVKCYLQEYLVSEHVVNLDLKLGARVTFELRSGTGEPFGTQVSMRRVTTKTKQNVKLISHMTESWVMNYKRRL